MDDSSCDNQPAKKRARTKNFTIQHKVLIIDLLDGSNFSQLNPQHAQLEKQECVRQHLMKTFDLKLGRSTISEIYKNKSGLIQIVKSDSSKFAQKSLKTSKYHNLEVMLADWVIKMRNEGCQVSGDAIQAKALEIAKSISIDDFKASCGWLCKFKERFKLRKRHISGTEIDNIDHVACASVKEEANIDGTTFSSNHSSSSSSIALNSNHSGHSSSDNDPTDVNPVESYRPINISSAIDFITKTLDAHHNTSKHVENKKPQTSEHNNHFNILHSNNAHKTSFMFSNSSPLANLYDDVVIPYAGGMECLHKAVQLVQLLPCTGILTTHQHRDLAQQYYREDSLVVDSC